MALPSLPQVPLALHQTFVQQPRQYIHIKTEPNLTAAASNIPAHLHSTINVGTKSTAASIVSSSRAEDIVSQAKSTTKSGQLTTTNIKKECDSSSDDQCDNSTNSSPSISPCSTSPVLGNIGNHTYF